MTDSKALIERLRDYGDGDYVQNHHDRIEAADHIEKLEAAFDQFRQEVSDAVEAYLAHMSPWPDNSLRRFILPKPDKQLRSIAADRLVYAASEYFCNRKNNLELIDAIVELAASAALAKRGLEVREIEG